MVAPCFGDASHNSGLTFDYPQMRRGMNIAALCFRFCGRAEKREHVRPIDGFIIGLLVLSLPPCVRRRLAAFLLSLSSR